MRRWAVLLFLLLPLAACSEVETDQARLCRMALPALSPPDADIRILGEAEHDDRRGVTIDFSRSLGGAAHRAECRFRNPGRPSRSEELAALKLDGDLLDETHRYFLVRFWLATPAARDADPSPLGNTASLPRLSFAAAYTLQQAINGLPLAATYALLSKRCGRNFTFSTRACAALYVYS